MIKLSSPEDCSCMNEKKVIFGLGGKYIYSLAPTEILPR